MAKKRAQSKRKRNWNTIAQEICAILIGIGMGLYGYESKAALVPMKWQLDKKVAKDMTRQHEERQVSSGSILDAITQIPEVNRFWEKTGADRYLNHAQKYNNVMQKWGVKGDLQQKMSSLMQSGVETVPKKWTSKENQPFFILGIALICIAFFIKISIYAGILNLNRLKFSKRSRAPGKKRANINAIINEICTFMLSAIAGLYLVPAMENFLQNQEASFPYPWLITVSFAFFVCLKIALRSSFLDFNAKKRGGKLISNKRFQKFSHTYNWNTFTHQVCTVIIGLFLGFYAYESNLALLPMKWQVERNVGTEVSTGRATTQQEPSFFEKLWNTARKVAPIVRDTEFWKKSGAERYLQHAQKYDAVLERSGVKGHLKTKVKKLIANGVDYVPDRWTQKGNLPFLLAAFILLIVSILIKWCLYLHIINFNDLVKKRKLIRRKGKKPPVNWNRIIHETAAIILGTLIGIYTEPFLDYLAGETNISYPYPTAGPVIAGFCFLIKVAIYMKWISFNKKRKVSKKPQRRRK